MQVCSIQCTGICQSIFPSYFSIEFLLIISIIYNINVFYSSSCIQISYHLYELFPNSIVTSLVITQGLPIIFIHTFYIIILSRLQYDDTIFPIHFLPQNALIYSPTHKTQEPQPQTNNYRSLRNVECRKNCLPQGRAHQLIIRYKVVSPENIYLHIFKGSVVKDAPCLSLVT